MCSRRSVAPAAAPFEGILRRRAWSRRSVATAAAPFEATSFARFCFCVSTLFGVGLRDSPSGATLPLDPPPLLPLTGPSRGSGLPRVRYRILVGARRLLERWVSAAVGFSCCAGSATHIFEPLPAPLHSGAEDYSCLPPPKYPKKQNEHTQRVTREEFSIMKKTKSINH